ncbi:MAG: hypothetical protein IJ299_02915 [Oscillospiraceae bacterium]|nr:hypothetical protein [Oscillospiraceae bacterium]
MRRFFRLTLKYEGKVLRLHKTYRLADRRFAPAFAKEIIDSGLIGELYFVESEYAHDYSESRGANDWRVTPERHAVIGGVSETKLAPQKTATRAECAVIFYRLNNK